MMRAEPHGSPTPPNVCFRPSRFSIARDSQTPRMEDQ